MGNPHNITSLYRDRVRYRKWSDTLKYTNYSVYLKLLDIFAKYTLIVLQSRLRGEPLLHPQEIGLLSHT